MGLSYLVVDDHNLFAQALRYMLQEIENLECAGIANNGEQAEVFLDDNEIDYVFMDLNMPGISGIELIQKIRKRNNRLKIIVVSMLTDGLVIMKAMDAGANGYVPKNTTFTELKECIDQVSKGRIFIPDVIKQEIKLLEQKHNSGWQIRNTDKKINILSERETEVLKLIAVGFTNKEIAEKLFLSPLTIKTHRTNILRKLGLKNSVSLANYAISLGNILEQ